MTTSAQRMSAAGLCSLPLLAAIALSTGCQTAQVDAQSVQSKAETPVALKVDWVTLPTDEAAPRFVVAVVPFADGAIHGGGQAVPTAPQADGSLGGYVTGSLQGGDLEGSLVSSGQRPGTIGLGMAAQLKTALSRWGNISLIDASSLVRQQDGTYTCRLNPGEIGPFIVRGTITEFNEAAEATEKKKGASLGGVGFALGVIGAFTGAPAVESAGDALATANPSIQNEERTRKGAVGIDLEIIDGRSTRIVGAFTCSGTFTTRSAVNGVSVFGAGGGSAAFAGSALGQATRAALNDALKQAAEALKRAPRGEIIAKSPSASSS